jgi:glycosyltransferase involved in cell wall biosynthesis
VIEEDITKMDACMNVSSANTETLRGAGFSQETWRTYDRSQLSPRRILRSLRDLRRLKPDRLYVLCRELSTQHNTFYLKLVGLLAGARELWLQDDAGASQRVTLGAFIARDVPLFVAALAYAVVAYLGFFALLGVLSLGNRRGRKAPRPDTGLPTDAPIGYLRTDFWFSLKAGGSVTHTRELINAGARLGHPVIVVSADPLEHYRLAPSVHLVKPSRLLSRLPQHASLVEYNLRFPLKAWRILRRSGTRLLYQRSSRMNVSGVALSRMLRIPLVLEFNSSDIWSARNWGHARVTFFEGLCERIGLASARTVAVVSKELKRALVSAGIPGARILVNPNGANATAFTDTVDSSRVQRLLPSGKVFIGFIGIFGQWHGVLTLASAVRHVVSCRPEAHFVVVGDGELKKEMVEILKRDGTLGDVSFMGTVRHEEAPAYLNVCSILVSPHEDMSDGSVFFGSPTKIFEYMAMGKGIVASRVGQLGEILQDGGTALLVEQRNPESLANGILRLIDNPELRERLGRNARERLLRDFTWEANFRRAVSGNENA